MKTIKWKKTSAMTRAISLTFDGKEIASLEYLKWYSRKVKATFYKKNYSFEFKGLFKPYVLIIDDNGARIGKFHIRTSKGKSKLDLLDGREYHWVSEGKWKKRYYWKNGRGEKIYFHRFGQKNEGNIYPRMESKFSELMILLTCYIYPYYAQNAEIFKEDSFYDFE